MSSSGCGPAGVQREAGAAPLWRQVRDDLERRLAAGAFSDLFPGELELVEQYEVSRHTVRQALSGLRDDGLVVSSRGRPPRVAEAADVALRLGGVYSLFDSVTSAGISQRSVVRAIGTTTDADAARHLGLAVRSRLLHIERLRMAGDEPLALDSVWLPATLGAPLLGADLADTSLYAAYAALCGVHVVEGRESIRAAVPSDEQRAHLDIGPDVAVVLIERLGCDPDGRRVEWRRTVVRADRIQLCSDVVGRHGYRPELLLPPSTGYLRARGRHPARRTDA